MVCLVLALDMTFFSDHFGGWAQLLYALMIVLSLHFLNGIKRIKPGMDFYGQTFLRIGVALLDARITLSQVAKLGPWSALAVVLAVVLTITSRLLLAKWMKRPYEEGLLSDGAVAICGASGTLAISSVLPQTKDNERFYPAGGGHAGLRSRRHSHGGQAFQGDVADAGRAAGGCELPQSPRRQYCRRRSAAGARFFAGFCGGDAVKRRNFYPIDDPAGE